MIQSIFSESLDDPRKFYHSHATGFDPLYFTSGIVSRKFPGEMLNHGVSFCNHTNAFLHDIDSQFTDIVRQLDLIANDIGIPNDKLLDSILDVKVFIVDVQKYFFDFNLCYGRWIGQRPNFPSRTTVGVNALPSNVVLEMSFILYRH